MPDDTREAILAVAREIIEKRGYLGLSMRTVAAAAGVTPEVARRYYRNRDALFAAAMKLPVDPSGAIPALVAPGIEGMGERLVRYMLDTLRDPEARAEIVSLARSGVNAGHAVSGLQEFLERNVVDRIAGMIGVPDARMRAALITSYLLGIAMTRYGVRLEPLSSASEEEVIRMVAPVVQDLLDPRKPIPGSARARQGEAATQDPRPMEADTPAVRTRTFIADPKAHAEALARERMARGSSASGRTPHNESPGARSPGAGGSGRGSQRTPTSESKASAPRDPASAKGDAAGAAE